MFRSLKLHPARKGFTLIELLVVMAIIAVLAALTLAGVMRLFGLGPRSKTHSEMTQMAAAIKECQQKLNLPYIPSKLVLVESGQYSDKFADHKMTLKILEKAFGRVAARQPVDWNRNGNTNEIHTLKGHHCLVFFLGGTFEQSGNLVACRGFSTDTLNPIDLSKGSRIGPFFEFQTERLRIDPENGFPYYLDPYDKGVPYTYFSHRDGAAGLTYYADDCKQCPIEAYKVASDPTQYLNPKSYQIISAGADGDFGAAPFVYDPRTGNSSPGHADNHASFAPGRLLVAGQ